VQVKTPPFKEIYFGDWESLKIQKQLKRQENTEIPKEAAGDFAEVIDIYNNEPPMWKSIITNKVKPLDVVETRDGPVLFSRSSMKGALSHSKRPPNKNILRQQPRLIVAKADITRQNFTRGSFGSSSVKMSFLRK
jgi:hypothetical protein